MQKDENGNSLTGDVCCQDLSNSMVIAHDRLVTCVGLKDIIVIETGDSILVADKKSNSGLKALVSTLNSRKREEAITSHARLYQWGSIREVSSTPNAILREIVIRPNQTYSRGHRDEATQCFVASGTVAFRIDGVTRQHARDESVYLEKNTFCDLKNIGQDSARLFEVEYKTAADSTTALPPADLFVVGGKRQGALAV
jgi:mannose-1-phosphate guanylyltransferase / mannose-6-phosphate isomerase